MTEMSLRAQGDAGNDRRDVRLPRLVFWLLCGVGALGAVLPAQILQVFAPRLEAATGLHRVAWHALSLAQFFLFFFPVVAAIRFAKGLEGVKAGWYVLLSIAGIASVLLVMGLLGLI